MASSRSSELRLFAAEDKSVDEKKVEIDCTNADLKFEGPQDFKIDFSSFPLIFFDTHILLRVDKNI